MCPSPPHEPPEGGRLVIDLDAVADNYATLLRMARGARVGAVVKADGYGLGAIPVSRRLVRAGCRDFFVAQLSEAARLVPELPGDARVFVLNGLRAGDEARGLRLGILPVLNSVPQARRWQALAAAAGTAAPAALQIDSGMSRLGAGREDLIRLAGDPRFKVEVPLVTILTHLACAETPRAPANAAQIALFAQLAEAFPEAPRSIANSAACLGPWRPPPGDLLRPGLALYGLAAPPGAGMAPVVRLEARVLQVRAIAAGTGVGYGLTYVAPAPRRIACVGFGYADGCPPSLGGRGHALFRGARLPILGRISMDSLIVDVTALAPGAISDRDVVELIGVGQTADELAAAAGLSAHQLLSGFGPRLERIHRGATTVAAVA